MDEMTRDGPVDPGDEAIDPRDRPIEPGHPTLENVLFVLLGAVGTVLVFLQGLGLL